MDHFLSFRPHTQALPGPGSWPHMVPHTHHSSLVQIHDLVAAYIFKKERGGTTATLQARSAVPILSHPRLLFLWTVPVLYFNRVPRDVPFIRGDGGYLAGRDNKYPGFNTLTPIHLPWLLFLTEYCYIAQSDP